MMVKDLHNPDVWISALLEQLPAQKLSSSLKDDNPDWEYIDGEIVKLGSLTHSQLNIPEIQQRGLELLATESKDFRLLAHLLRTLQHTGKFLLALRLLVLFVEHYWSVAAPQNMTHKQRFAAQVVKRFESGVSSFAENANGNQRAALLEELAKLTQRWKSHNAPSLAQAVEALQTLFDRAFRDGETAPSALLTTTGSMSQFATVAGRNTQQNATSDENTASEPMPLISIDSSDEKSWRGSLLNVADILCKRHPGLPLGYRLRRHALWHTITAAPLAESDGRTPLAAMPVDMAGEYQAGLASADIRLWEQVEKSLLLAPYWLDGQHLSALIALRLGYEEVALAICDETTRFLLRLPTLTSLQFNDRTPFLSEKSQQWLASNSGNNSAIETQTDETLQAARACFAEHGLETALRYLNAQPVGDPRDQFYRQYLGAQLMEEAGLTQFAREQYRSLFRSGQQMMLADWEPHLLGQLEQKFMAEQ